MSLLETIPRTMSVSEHLDAAIRLSPDRQVLATAKRLWASCLLPRQAPSPANRLQRPAWPDPQRAAGQEMAFEDCEWKADERVTPWMGDENDERSVQSGTMDTPTGPPAASCSPPPPSLPGAPSAARSRPPFRAGCRRLVQGPGRSVAFAGAPRSRCVRGLQERLEDWRPVEARRPTGAGPPRLHLTHTGLLMESHSCRPLRGGR